MQSSFQDTTLPLLSTSPTKINTKLKFLVDALTYIVSTLRGDLLMVSGTYEKSQISNTSSITTRATTAFVHKVSKNWLSL